MFLFQVDNSYLFRLLSVHFRDTDVRLATTCLCPLKTTCRIDCDDETVMKATTEKTYKGTVLDLYQFWVFFALLFAICSFMCLSGLFINPICLDILGRFNVIFTWTRLCCLFKINEIDNIVADENSVDYGKQKLWGSIGWGISSIVVGWIVDLYSLGKKDKDYTPVFVSCIVITIVNLIVITKIKVRDALVITLKFSILLYISDSQYLIFVQVVEITKSNSVTCHNVVGLFTKHYVIVFIIWSTMCTFLHAIITHYLFW